MKVILFMATSINGMIATPDGNEDFLSHDNWTEFIELAKKTGNFIYGRKTYEAVSTWGEEFLKDIRNIPTPIVISTDMKTAESGFTVTASPQEAINLLSEKGYKEILLTGGSINNSSFAKEGLIDEIILNIEPVAVGKGIPLFAPDDFELNLELIESKNINPNTIQLRYKVLKP